jgi:hypothetical protein
MQENHLGFGCVDSTPSHMDIQSENVAMSAFGVNSFEKKYTVIHDNQRKVGICTMAMVADILYQMYGVEVSEQFGYVGGKKMYDKNMYEGSSIKTMLEFARVVGLPKKSLVPTDDTTKSYQDYVNVDFSQEAWDDAKNQKIGGYYQVKDLSLSNLLKEGDKSEFGLCIMIMNGNGNWYLPSWDKVSPLRSGKPYDGAHATKIIKGDLLGGVIRNTWGDKNNPIIKERPDLVWANNGDIDFFWDTIKDDIREVWVVTRNPIEWTHTFTTPILYKQSGTEVVNLQRALVKLGFLTMPKGVAYGYYGDITRRAVFNYQVSRQVAQLTELNALQGKRVGYATIKALNKDISLL